MKDNKIQESVIVILNNLELIEVKGSRNLSSLLASIVGLRDLVNYINESKETDNE